MEKEKMLVTQALNELKLLDSRIEREISNTGFVTAAKTADKKVTPSVTKEEYIASANAGYQSIMDLIQRRAKIKAAVVASNAVTKVTINDEEMTVAEAIELKTSISYEIKLLRTLKTQYDRAKSVEASQNLVLEDRIDKYIETMLGKDAKGKKDDYSEMITPIRTANEYSLVDPLKAEEKIVALENRIDGFRSKVDAVLQVSNCVTVIEF